ncbi:unnamed protein product [Rhizoctonia solani]|uniref:Uncharacterized protein n=1 Tax=Rhizoctonia solani TaxID=456999 RepID=A0A8H3CLD5_9AGAM|nr:unnamed protein product [Rhizoctonia solani]
MAVVEISQQSETGYLTVTYNPPGQGTTVQAAAIPLSKNYGTALTSAKEALCRHFPRGSSTNKHWWLAIPVKTKEGDLWAEVSPEAFPDIIKQKETEFRLCEDHQNVGLLPLGGDRDITYKLKLIVIGEMSVGKSMMFEYFTKLKKDRSTELSPTLGARSDISTRFITAQSARLRVELWDTGTTGYSIQDQSKGSSLIKVQNVNQSLSWRKWRAAWLKDLRNETNEDAPIMLVGNQIDLSDLREVGTSEGKKFADDNNLLFAEISAKEGTGVDNAFHTLVNEVFNQLKKHNKLSEYDTSKRARTVELNAQDEKDRSYLSIWLQEPSEGDPLGATSTAASGPERPQPSHTPSLPPYSPALGKARLLTVTYIPPGDSEATSHTALIPWTNDYELGNLESSFGFVRIARLDVTVLPIGHEQTTAEGDSYYQFKIITVGQRNVGKSMMLQYFTKPEEARLSTLSSTVGPSMDIANRFMTAHGELVKTVLWDTAGQEAFRAMTKPLYRGVHGVFLVYSIADAESFNNCPEWLTEIRAHVDENVPIMLIGNQIDRTEGRAVETSDAQAFAIEHKLLFAEISGMYGTNVETAFQKLVHGEC